MQSAVSPRRGQTWEREGHRVRIQQVRVDHVLLFSPVTKRTWKVGRPYFEETYRFVRGNMPPAGEQRPVMGF